MNNIDTCGDFDLHIGQALMRKPPPPNVIDLINHPARLQKLIRDVTRPAIETVTSAHLESAERNLMAAQEDMRRALQGAGLRDDLWEEAHSLMNMARHCRSRLAAVIRDHDNDK